MNKKKFILAVALSLSLLFLAMKVFAFFSDPAQSVDFENAPKNIEIIDDGLEFRLGTTASSVVELLEEKGIVLGEYDKIMPDKDAALYASSRIIIIRATRIKIHVDGKTVENHVLGKTVQEALRESGITLSRLDKTTPEIHAFIQDDTAITVTRINVEEIVEKEDIAFKTVIKNDSKMGWQEKKTETPGQLGEKEVRYRVTYKNGKEISREILNSEIVTPPVTQIEVHGTYMKLGKANSGQGTWYAYKGGMFAASTTIPKGAYAKVTNTANGKSVVVQINDYGPQGKGRVIDLDKVAFAKIASIGAGVIGVKVEPVLN